MATFSMLPLGKRYYYNIHPMKNGNPVSLKQAASFHGSWDFSSMFFHGSGWPPPK